MRHRAQAPELLLRTEGLLMRARPSRRTPRPEARLRARVPESAKHSLQYPKTASQAVLTMSSEQCAAMSDERDTLPRVCARVFASARPYDLLVGSKRVRANLYR